MELDLNNITEQEEYEILLEIPDDQDVITSRISLKLLFIWSFYEFNKSKLEKVNKNISNLELLLKKSENIINSLNEPFSNIELMENAYNAEEMIRDTSKGYLTNNKKKDNKISLVSKYEGIIASKTEQLMSGALSKNFNNNYKIDTEFQSILILRILLLILLIICFLNTVVYSEMVNLLFIIAMFVIVSTSYFTSNSLYYSSVVIKISIFLVLYDVIFLAFHTGSTQLLSFYIGFLTIINFIGFVLKVCLVICSIVLKVKIEKIVEKEEIA